MQQENEQKRNRFRNTINTIYKQNYIGRKLQDYNFNNFQINSNNQYAVKVANDYINKNNSKLQSNGLIIMGKSGVGKTHLAAAIANKLIELYSNVDMIIIDDLGTEKISSWALEKLYTIIQNRFENGLPIIITTRFDKKD